MTYYAKSSQPDGAQETVRQHLQCVEILAQTYGRTFGAEIPAGLCGLFHDFGKYSAAFQKVLQGTQAGIDHAIGGAAFLYGFQKEYQKKALCPIIEAVAAHHSHLVSREDLTGVLEAVLGTEGPVTTLCGKQAALCGEKEYQEAIMAFQADFPDFRFPPFKTLPPQPTFATQEDSMLYTRMLFSCLVDADYTASSHTPPEEGPPLDVSTALKNLYDHCKALRKHSGADPVLNQYRTRLFERCGQSGEQNGGLFTLTAPTGTGKTLALLHFALRHCQHTGKHRIIVVLPFLSLIEQSAGVYRKILPHVMEDHSQSQLPEEMRDHAARWDQPFLITTSVRFFESLFSDHPTDCRKLHNLANSVILFDEAQSLPVSLLSLLSPTLKVIEELCTRYGCSVVFSTATQPDYTGLREINWSASELLPEHSEFYRALRRTAAHWEIDTPTPLEEIAERMTQHQNVCTIVNLRVHARTLYQALARLCPEEEVFLLSTDLCPAHRTEVIQAIHRRQKEKLPCRVVSTQCIEAGVDLDFDCLYRALAPLEAIIQASGRCNRNGKSAYGELVVFVPAEDRLYPDSHYENGATIVRAMQMQQPIDIHDPEIIRHYYRQLLGTFRGDKKSRALEKALAERDFPAVSQQYRLIEQRGVQIIVPYEGQRALYDKLRSEALETGLTKALLRMAAPLTVTCYDRQLIQRVCEPLFLAGKSRPETRESPYYVILSGQENCYDRKMGFCPPEKQGLQISFW